MYLLNFKSLDLTREYWENLISLEPNSFHRNKFYFLGTNFILRERILFRGKEYWGREFISWEQILFLRNESYFEGTNLFCENQLLFRRNASYFVGTILSKIKYLPLALNQSLKYALNIQRLWKRYIVTSSTV